MYPLSASMAALTMEASAKGARDRSCPFDAKTLFAFAS